MKDKHGIKNIKFSEWMIILFMIGVAIVLFVHDIQISNQAVIIEKLEKTIK